MGSGKLFIPRKDTKRAHQPGYGTDMRAIEAWGQSLGASGITTVSSPDHSLYITTPTTTPKLEVRLAQYPVEETTPGTRNDILGLAPLPTGGSLWVPVEFYRGASGTSQTVSPGEWTRVEHVALFGLGTTTRFCVAQLTYQCATPTRVRLAIVTTTLTPPTGVAGIGYGNGTPASGTTCNTVVCTGSTGATTVTLWVYAVTAEISWPTRGPPKTPPLPPAVVLTTLWAAFAVPE